MNDRNLQHTLAPPGAVAAVPAVPAAAAAAAWRRALPALLLALVWIVVCYRATALGMVGIWARSETFAHGFIVPPIVLWLIWRDRARLAALTPRPAPWLLLPFAGAGCAWLLGELAAVNVVAQFAFTALLVLAVPAVLGLRVARALAFPLAFLFFAVPFGEFAMPQLMEWTAQFTVLGLRLSGVPVYREGLSFVIPSGHWSVVEACSGVRYVIASLTVGTLFAYLSYRSLGRRLLFVGVSLLVPVVANWLRAYLIVMLGHLSGNKLAAGVDHLIYGWLFFGLVILAMFWIGARWREDLAPPAAPQPLAPAPVVASAPGAAGAPWAAGAVMALALLWPLAEWRIEGGGGEAAADVRLAALGDIPGWRAMPAPPSDWRPRFDNPAASLNAGFASDKGEVGVFLGYYRRQDDSRKLVSSENALVKSSDPFWVRLAGGQRTVFVGELPLVVRTALLRGPDRRRLAVWQWYWVGGRLTASDALAKVYTALARLAGRGDDSAVVILYAPGAAEDAAGPADASAASGASESSDFAALAAFAHAAAPAIEAALRQTAAAP